MARGEYIALLDADDAWEPRKLDLQVQFLRANPACVFVHTGRCVIDSQGSVVRRLDLPPLDGMALERLIRRNSVTASSVLVRKDRLPPASFAEILGVEDWDLWLQLAALGPVGFIPEPLTLYRVHDSNISKRATLMLEGRVKVLDRLLGRPLSAKIKEVALKERHSTVLSLAHALYELEDYSRARSIFREAGMPLSRVDVQRWLVSGLPALLRSFLRGMRKKSRTFASGQPSNPTRS